MYQLYNLIDSKWDLSGKPFAADSRRRAIAYVRALSYSQLTDRTGVVIRHMMEGTFKVVKV